MSLKVNGTPKPSEGTLEPASPGHSNFMYTGLERMAVMGTEGTHNPIAQLASCPNANA
jgi:hypothetical protein